MERPQRMVEPDEIRSPQREELPTDQKYSPHTEIFTSDLFEPLYMLPLFIIAEHPLLNNIEIGTLKQGVAIANI